MNRDRSTLDVPRDLSWSPHRLRLLIARLLAPPAQHLAIEWERPQELLLRQD